ncbi:MAG: TetR/AcrR family transcriptional regulator [Gammaproteobacteria bacterium]|nr:TetR/AcrR family transcriptional regulator [Gammaproteobacteria bacterium]
MSKESSYHHGNLREALLEAGTKLVEEKGVADVSLRAVAKAAGVSHTAPYRHFSDKNAMLRGIAATGFRLLAQRIEEAVELHPGNPELQLSAAGVAYVELAIEHPRLHNLMFGGVLQDDAVDDSLEERSDQAFKGLVGIIALGQQAGVFRRGDTDELALTAWSLVHGFAMLASTGTLDHRAGGQEAKLALAHRVANHLLSGLAKR